MTEEEIIQAYAKHARPVMRRFVEPQTCVGATRVTCQFFERWQMSAQPVPCRFAFKVPARRYMYVAGLTGRHKARLRKGTREWCEHRPTGPRWSGHLVALVKDRYLIDASIDEATNLEYGVVVPPIALVIDLAPEGRIALTGTVAAGVTLEDGTPAEITYISSDDHRYVKSEGWNDDVAARGLTLLIERAIQGRL